MLTPMVFAPQEQLDLPMMLYVVSRGVAACQGRPITKGSTGNIDFIVDKATDVDFRSCVALTYVEVTTLSRDEFMSILAAFPQTQAVVKRAANFYKVRTKLARFGRVVRVFRRGQKGNTVVAGLTPPADGGRGTSVRVRRQSHGFIESTTNIYAIPNKHEVGDQEQDEVPRLKQDIQEVKQKIDVLQRFVETGFDQIGAQYKSILLKLDKSDGVHVMSDVAT